AFALDATENVNVGTVAAPLAMDRTRSLPEATEFSRYPATWYLFCRSSDVWRKPVSKTILDRQLVAFRTTSGKVAVLDARCAHLGANLGRGKVRGDTLECPFHHWRYGADGRCASTATMDCGSSAHRMRSYPVVERHGFVYFFFGPRPLFPLPF